MKYFLILLFCLSSIFASSQCLKANISILLDWSGSESGHEGEIAQAAYNFVNGLHVGEDQVKVSITSFYDDGDTNTLNYSTFVDLSGNTDDINAGILTLSEYAANGGTEISDAIDESVRQINSDGRNDVYKIIIIVSDGEISDYLEASLKIFNYKLKIPLNVYAVQIGGMILPMAPLMMAPKNSIKLNILSPISDDGFENLSTLTGNTNRVAISTIQGFVEALKKLDMCM